MKKLTKSKKFTYIISYVAGVIFGMGLISSLMVNPAKVLGFLDVFGQWDFSLALVMVSAIAVGLLGFTAAKRWQKTGKTALNGEVVSLPQTQQISKQLVLGSVLFGIGWGLAGLCPAPAMVAAAVGNSGAAVFVVAMFLGFGLQALTQSYATKKGK